MIEAFERVCERAAVLLEKWQAALIGLYVAIFLTYFLRLARHREMWSDEFYSLYISRLSLGEMWKAILTGADQHPPLFYLLTHYCLVTFGESQLVLRLPATFGFLLMSLCLFRFTTRRMPALFGFIAMLFPILTGAMYYAHEARGYGMVLGFSALALVCWQRAAEQTSGRGVAIAGMAASLSVAVGCHYYAVFVLVPLAAGEIVRAVRLRRPDWLVWIGLVAPLLTLLAYLPAIRSAREYGATFWATPEMRYAVHYFFILFSHSIVPVVGGFVIITAYAHLSRRPAPAEPDGANRLRTHETVALLVGVALPVIVVIAAKLGQGGFHPRYVLFPVAAFSIMLAAGVAVLPVNRTVGGTVILTLMLGWLSYRVTDRLLDRWSADVSEVRFLRTSTGDTLPIVVSETSVMFRLSHYGPADISKRLVYLADPQRALEYLKHDTVDKGLLALQPWFPLNIQPYRDYLARNQEFLVYGQMDGNWNWLVSAFAADDIQPTLVAFYGGRQVMHVRPSANRPVPTHSKISPEGLPASPQAGGRQLAR